MRVNAAGVTELGPRAQGQGQRCRAGYEVTGKAKGHETTLFPLPLSGQTQVPSMTST